MEIEQKKPRTSSQKLVLNQGKHGSNMPTKFNSDRPPLTLSNRCSNRQMAAMFFEIR